LKKGVANGTPLDSVESNGRVDAVVAERMGTSRSEVIKAAAVKKENPEGFQKLKDGAST
jgi:hypothetical protein